MGAGAAAGPLAWVGLSTRCTPHHELAVWLRQEGALLVLYFLVGMFAYAYFEGWGALDASYFLMVTATTVGYGDLTPLTPMGRLFTCAYALVGITLVLAAIAPFLNAILQARRAVERLLGALASCCARPAPAHASAEARRINYPLRYLSAMLGPLMVLLFGILLALLVLGLSWIDALYWAVVSMTTVGFGDLHPNSPLQKLVAICYLPLAVTALGDALKEVATISVRRAIAETDYLAVADGLLLEEAAGDPDETLTEAEFMVSVLKSHNLVDEPTLAAIRAQFLKLTRDDEPGGRGPLEPRVLDARMVFAELVEQSRVRQRPRGAHAGQTELDPATHEAVPLVNLRGAGGGYHEWRQYYWLRMVAEHPSARGVAGAMTGEEAAPAREEEGDDERGEGGLSRPPRLRPPPAEYLAALLPRRARARGAADPTLIAVAPAAARARALAPVGPGAVAGRGERAQRRTALGEAPTPASLPPLPLPPPPPGGGAGALPRPPLAGAPQPGDDGRRLL